MRKGFTLVELLVVVVVIVTMMAITFRLSSVGSDTSKRSKTINKMQRIENCLSGYYAAYGSYPPVQLHGSRDYTLAVNAQGIQQVGTGSGGTHESELTWKSVEAACRSQPIGMMYPFSDPKMKDFVDQVSKIHQQRANSSDPKYKKFRDNPALQGGYVALVDNGPISAKSDLNEWTDVQVFQLGVLSYILPRFLVMFSSSRSSNSSGIENIYEEQSQWTLNNQLPFDFETGAPYTSWSQVINTMKNDMWKIAALPSQSVCARWIQNLEGTVSVQFAKSIFGVNIRDPEEGGVTGVSIENPYPPIFSAGKSQTGASGSSGSTSSQYVVDGMTVRDGWRNEFYYYSPAPHQTYTLWSAGPNGKTFPPWIATEEIKRKLDDDEFKEVQEWIADDIVNMRN